MFYYVYILQSIKNPDKFYVGYTENIKNRLIKHNEGGVASTKEYKPWKIKNTISFIEKEKALAFEKYLESHWVGVFVEKHF